MLHNLVEGYHKFRGTLCPRKLQETQNKWQALFTISSASLKALLECSEKTCHQVILICIKILHTF